MTEADTFLLTLKEKFVWTTFITSDGLRIISRIISLRHNDKAGFYVISRKTQRKNDLIRRNPGVTLSIFPGSGFFNAVVQATARTSQSKDDVDNCWHEDLLKANYKGKDDPDLEVILLTIHSIQLGPKVYQGHPIDYSKYAIINRDTPLKQLPAAPYLTAEATAELKKVVSKERLGVPVFHLITSDGIFHDDRMMETRYDEKFGLHQFSNSTGKKITQLQTSPNVSLLCELPADGKYLVADCVARVCVCPDVKKELTTGDRALNYKEYGYTGPEDPKLAVILYAVRSVTVYTAATHETKTYVCEPTEYDKNEQILYRAAASRENVYLNTVDEKGIPHSRMMWFLHYHPTVGFLLTTREDDKTKQIRANPHITITCFDTKTTDEYVFDLLGTVVSDKGRRHLHWTEKMKSAGYTGPEDESQLHIALNVQKATLRNVKAFWASVGRPEDGGKWQ